MGLLRHRRIFPRSGGCSERPRFGRRPRDAGLDNKVSEHIAGGVRTSTDKDSTETNLAKFALPVGERSPEVGGILNLRALLDRHLAEQTLSEAMVFEIYEQLLRELTKLEHHPDGRIHHVSDLAHVEVEESGGELLVHLLGDGNSGVVGDVGRKEQEKKNIREMGASDDLLSAHLFLLDMLGVPSDVQAEIALHPPQTHEDVEGAVNLVVGFMKAHGIVEHGSRFRGALRLALRFIGNQMPASHPVLLGDQPKRPSAEDMLTLFLAAQDFPDLDEQRPLP